MFQKKNYDTKRPKEKEMIFGIRAVIEAIEAGKVLDKVLLRRDMSSAIGRELLLKLEGTSTPIQRVPVENSRAATLISASGFSSEISPIIGKTFSIASLTLPIFEPNILPDVSITKKRIIFLLGILSLSNSPIILDFISYTLD